MKRVLTVLALLAFGGGAFALDVGLVTSVGLYSRAIAVANPAGDQNIQASRIPFTMEAYVDLTYLQVGLGYSVRNGGNVTTGGVFAGFAGDYPFNDTYLTIQIFGKVPIFSDVITVFPLFGFEFDVNLTDTMGGFDQKASNSAQANRDLDEVWLKGGVGAHVLLFEKIYVKPEFLFGYKLGTTTEEEFGTKLQSTYPGSTNTRNTILTVDFMLLVGYKL